MTPAALAALTTMGIGMYNSTGSRRIEDIRCEAVRNKIREAYDTSLQLE
jgi:hypothetical protein